MPNGFAPPTEKILVTGLATYKLLA